MLRQWRCCWCLFRNGARLLSVCATEGANKSRLRIHTGYAITFSGQREARVRRSSRSSTAKPAHVKGDRNRQAQRTGVMLPWWVVDSTRHTQGRLLPLEGQGPLPGCRAQLTKLRQNLGCANLPHQQQHRRPRTALLMYNMATVGTATRTTSDSAQWAWADARHTLFYTVASIHTCAHLHAGKQLAERIWAFGTARSGGSKERNRPASTGGRSSKSATNGDWLLTCGTRSAAQVWCK